MMNKYLVIVPIYNEIDNISFILDDLKQAKDCDIVFINDASTDDSLVMLQQNGQSVLDLPTNLGIGGCVQTGYKYAWGKGYDIVIQYDGDGQHSAKDIPLLIDEIKKGYDYVIGSRFIKQKDLRLVNQGE